MIKEKDKRTEANKTIESIGKDMRKKVKQAYEAKIAQDKAKLESERNMA